MLTHSQNIRVIVVDNNSHKKIAYDESLRLSLPDSAVLSYCDKFPRAVREITRGTYDLVVFDLPEEGRGGVKTIKKIREYNGDIPLIVMTKEENHSNALRAIMAGADDYFIVGRDDDGLTEKIISHAMHRYGDSYELPYNN